MFSFVVYRIENVASRRPRVQCLFAYASKRFFHYIPGADVPVLALILGTSSLIFVQGAIKFLSELAAIFRAIEKRNDWNQQPSLGPPNEVRITLLGPWLMWEREETVLAFLHASVGVVAVLL